MGLDRAIGAQGLDDPAELALASVMLGHIEAAGNTRYDSTDPRGEAVGSLVLSQKHKLCVSKTQNSHTYADGRSACLLRALEFKNQAVAARFPHRARMSWRRGPRVW